MPDLRGTKTLVTGAGRGLGAALARALAEQGCTPILCGRDIDALSQVATVIADATGVVGECRRLDLADPVSVTETVAAVIAEHQRLDILVNNGAMWLEASDADHRVDEVLSVVNAAVTGTFLLTQGLLPALRRSERPDIVTIGSISGLPNAPLQSASVPFYAAKRAQAGLADGFAQMLAGTPVRSIVIHPPYLDDVGQDDPQWDAAAERRKGKRATNRDIVEAVLFAITRPRHVTLSITVDADEGGLHPRPAR